MANFLKRWGLGCGLALWASLAGAQTLTVGGVGSLTPLLQDLVAQYHKQHPQVVVQIVDPPMGSSGALRALAAGKLDLALSGRVLKDTERGAPRPWVQTPLVLATSDAPVKSLDTATITRIYAGEVHTWSNGTPLRLILRGAFESETLMLRRLSPALDAAVMGALQRRDAPVADNDLEALALIGKISGSLGSTSLGLVLSTQSPVHVIALNGRVPSAEALASGEYPWSRPYYLVLPAEVSPALRDFVTFLMSEATMKRVRQMGYIPFKG